MKTITTLFNDTLLKPAITVVRQVYYKRRYWSGSAYVWEAAWTQVTEDKIIAVSPITSQLDIQTQTQFAISSVTINLRNFDNEWGPGNTSGHFGADGASSIGYEPFWTKFQIRGGLVYPGNASELVTLFTGVATDLNFNTRSHEVQITVSGLQDLLVRSDASNLATTVTAESLGTGNGSTTVYTTANVGVAVVKSVSVANVVKRAGVDYTLSQMADPVNPGKITFIVAPANATALTITYTYLAQGQRVEQLITSLLNLVPIPAGNQQVATVTFPTNIINTHTYQLQADWVAGLSLTDIDTAFLVNSIKLDFTSTDARQLTTYGDLATGWSVTGGFSVVFATSYLSFSGLSAGGTTTAYRALTTGSGRWDFGINMGSITNVPFDFFFMAQSINTAMTPSLTTSTDASHLYSGYLVRFAVESGGGPYTVRLMRADGSGVLATSLVSTTVTKDSSDHTLTIIRYPSGLILVKYDGTQILSTTDLTYQTGNYIGVFGGAKLYKTGTVYTPATTLTGTWISTSFDSGATPTAWNTFLSTQATSGGTVTYSTAGSPDNSSYDAYVAAASGVTIASALRRYLRTKIILVSTLASNQDPSASSVTVGSLTSSTVVTMANFTGMTVYDAITQLAAFSNYEFGFDASENFFFRARSGNTTPLLTLSESNFIVDVLSLQGGYDLVYSGVRASYGTYTSEVDDTSLGVADPTPRFGANIYALSETSVLISADADLASNIATAQFAYYKTPRRKIKLATKFLPQIDLSDIISVAFSDFSIMPGWYWGDADAYWGRPDIYYYGSQQEALGPLTTKVVGYRVDTDNWACELDLEEVV